MSHFWQWKFANVGYKFYDNFGIDPKEKAKDVIFVKMENFRLIWSHCQQHVIDWFTIF